MKSETNRQLLIFALAGQSDDVSISSPLSSARPKNTTVEVFWRNKSKHKNGPTPHDNSKPSSDTDAMTDISRDELKAHLETQNLKVDARLVSFEQVVKDAMGEIRLEMSGMRGDLKAVEADLGHLKDLKSSMRNTTLAIVGAIVASTLTIFFGIQSSNSSLVSSTIAGFGVGKDIATAQAAMAQQTKDTQALLQQIQEQQKALRVVPPPAKSK